MLTSLPRPAEFAEQQLIDAILSGRYPIDACLPAERELAVQIGVTRPTLREALQRLGREGWLEIRQGKPTRVRDYWREGSLGVLNALAHHPAAQPPDFITHLLEVRLALAPAYSAQAVARRAGDTTAFLAASLRLADDPADFAAFDWQLHRRLAELSGNPIYLLILNGFGELYLPLAERYFQAPEPRQYSRQFYADLLAAAQAGDSSQAEQTARAAMRLSLDLWQAR